MIKLKEKRYTLHQHITHVQIPCHVDGVLMVRNHLVHEDNKRVAVFLNSHLVVHLERSLKTILL